jgi:hypothetical protein
MTGGATFAEVLDQELAAFSPQEPVVVPAPPTASYRAPHPLLFTERRMPFHAGAYGAPQATTGARSLAAFVEPQLPPPARPRRAMTLVQRQALAELIALGADLAGDFDAHDLRSVYRSLALQYHPDRHPSSNRVEQARLAHLFAQLNESHRQLQMLFGDSDTQH